ncbi:MAG: hypothetical protein V3W41_14565 [Planctomycetota bacterium]
MGYKIEIVGPDLHSVAEHVALLDDRLNGPKVVQAMPEFTPAGLENAGNIEFVAPHTPLAVAPAPLVAVSPSTTVALVPPPGVLFAGEDVEVISGADSPDPLAAGAAPTPPAPPAPPTPAPAPPGPPAPAGLGGAAPGTDVHGRAWDERIHTKAQTKVADGSWRYKRNVDKTLAAQIEAAQPGPSGLPWAAAPVAPTQPALPPDPIGPTVAETISLASTLLAAAGNSGEAAMAEMGTAINAVMIAAGLQTSNDLIAQPEKAPVVYAGLQAAGQQRGVQC